MVHHAGSRSRFPSVRPLDFHQNLISCLHGHATEIGDKMDTAGVAGQITFCALLALFAPEGQYVTAVTAPIGAHVVVVGETMGDTVVQFGLVRICFCIGLCNALGDYLGVALLVARVLAV